MAKSKTTTQTASRTRRPASPRRKVPQIPPPRTLSESAWDLRLRRWTAKLVAELPVEIVDARRVLVLANALARQWLLGDTPRRVPDGGFPPDHERLLRSYAAKFVSDLPSSSSRDVLRSLVMAETLIEGWLAKGLLR